MRMLVVSENYRKGGGDSETVNTWQGMHTVQRTRVQKVLHSVHQLQQCLYSLHHRHPLKREVQYKYNITSTFAMLPEDNY